MNYSEILRETKKYDSSKKYFKMALDMCHFHFPFLFLEKECIKSEQTLSRKNELLLSHLYSKYGVTLRRMKEYDTIEFYYKESIRITLKYKFFSHAAFICNSYALCLEENLKNYEKSEEYFLKAIEYCNQSIQRKKDKHSKRLIKLASNEKIKKLTSKLIENENKELDPNSNYTRDLESMLESFKEATDEQETKTKQNDDTTNTTNTVETAETTETTTTDKDMIQDKDNNVTATGDDEKEPKQEEIKCDKNHDPPLRLFSKAELIAEESGYVGGYICNECVNSYPNEGSYHCSQCNYDLCHKCHKNWESIKIRRQIKAEADNEDKENDSEVEDAFVTVNDFSNSGNQHNNHAFFFERNYIDFLRNIEKFDKMEDFIEETVPKYELKLENNNEDDENVVDRNLSLIINTIRGANSRSGDTKDQFRMILSRLYILYGLSVMSQDAIDFNKFDKAIKFFEKAVQLNINKRHVYAAYGMFYEYTAMRIQSTMILVKNVEDVICDPVPIDEKEQEQNNEKDKDKDKHKEKDKQPDDNNSGEADSKTNEKPKKGLVATPKV